MKTPVVFSRIKFLSPFRLKGIAGLQPAGTYSIETHDDYLWEFPFSWTKRTRSKIRICSTPGIDGALQQVDICPRELFRAISNDQFDQRRISPQP